MSWKYLGMGIAYFRIKSITAVTSYYKICWVNQVKPGQINIAMSEIFHTRFSKFQFLLRKMCLFSLSLTLCTFTPTYTHIYNIHIHKVTQHIQAYIHIHTYTSALWLTLGLFHVVLCGVMCVCVQSIVPPLKKLLCESGDRCVWNNYNKIWPFLYE